MLSRALTPARRRSMYPLRKHTIIKAGKTSRAGESSLLYKEHSSENEENLEPGATDSEKSEGGESMDWQRRRIAEVQNQGASSRRQALRGPAPLRLERYEEIPDELLQKEQSAKSTVLEEVEEEDVDRDDEGKARAMDSVETHAGAKEQWCETVGPKRRRLGFDL